MEAFMRIALVLLAGLSPAMVAVAQDVIPSLDELSEKIESLSAGGAVNTLEEARRSLGRAAERVRSLFEDYERKVGFLTTANDPQPGIPANEGVRKQATADVQNFTVSVRKLDVRREGATFAGSFEIASQVHKKAPIPSPGVAWRYEYRLNRNAGFWEVAGFRMVDAGSGGKAERGLNRNDRRSMARTGPHLAAAQLSPAQKLEKLLANEPVRREGERVVLEGYVDARHVVPSVGMVRRRSLPLGVDEVLGVRIGGYGRFHSISDDEAMLVATIPARMNAIGRESLSGDSPGLRLKYVRCAADSMRCLGGRLVFVELPREEFPSLFAPIDRALEARNVAGMSREEAMRVAGEVVRKEWGDKPATSEERQARAARELMKMGKRFFRARVEGRLERAGEFLIRGAQLQVEGVRHMAKMYTALRGPGLVPYPTPSDVEAKWVLKDVKILQRLPVGKEAEPKKSARAPTRYVSDADERAAKRRKKVREGLTSAAELAKAGKFEETLAEYEKLLRNYPEAAPQIEEAREAVRTNPEYVRAKKAKVDRQCRSYLNRAQNWLRVGEKQKAKQYLKKIIELAPDSSWAVKARAALAGM